jgi:hypothetical protein
MNANNETLTKTERAELRSLIRRRAVVAKKDVDVRREDLLADFEEQLATEYKADDDRWAEVTRSAERAVAEANRELTEKLTELGIAEKFRPSLYLQWFNRGENINNIRRGELRKVATRRLDAMAGQAKLAIDRQAVQIEGRLAATALQSAEAAEWLASLPQVDQLLQALDVGSVRRELEIGDGRK